MKHEYPTDQPVTHRSGTSAAAGAVVLIKSNFTSEKKTEGFSHQ